jgi:BASS family bile acid:Na+ symporter
VIDLDAITIHFNAESRQLMNGLLAFIMFGVAMDIQWAGVRKVVQKPRGIWLGMMSQFILLPALTTGLIFIIQPQASVALGMILLASVPGGNISNFMSSLARGNIELSISLTAISSVASIVMTPFNFMFWGSLYQPASEVLRTIQLEPLEVFQIIAVLLVIPLFLGTAFRSWFPLLADRIKQPIKILSILIFLGFVAVAFYANFDRFTTVIQYIAGYVFLHHSTAVLSGYFVGALGRLDEPSRRTLAIETGIQNSGLALILIFNFFDGLGGMALMAAWWSIWHITIGLLISGIWSRFAP